MSGSQSAEEWGQRVLQRLQAEREEVDEWVASDTSRLHSILAQAAEVRAIAHELIDDRSRQGWTRQSREDDLIERRDAVRARLASCPTERPNRRGRYVSFSANPGLNDEVDGRDSFRHRWDPDVESSPQRDRIDQLADALRSRVGELHGQREALRQRVEQALSRMEATVGEALYLSTRSFRQPEAKSGASLPKAALLPMAAFLLVAGLGIATRPAPVPGWCAVAVLIGAVSVAAVQLLARRARAASVATFAVGFSFATFTAAYLAARIVDPESVSNAQAPVGSIADAAFTSLTVGLTGGTIGIELSGAARVIAFAQILLTVTFVASGIGWAWRRLTRPERPESEPPREESRIR